MKPALVLVVLVACGGEQPHPTAAAPSRPTSPSLTSIGSAPTEIDAGVFIDAAVAMRACFCFSWVHLDENGEFCYPTSAACDERFRSFARHDKIPCRADQKPSCERIACVQSGAKCYRE